MSDYAEIPLLAKDGTVVGQVKVDRADEAWLRQWTWRLSRSTDRQGRPLAPYATRSQQVNGHRRTVYMHRELLGLPIDKGGVETDHRNGDGLDNRRSNLRAVTPAQNKQNRRSWGKSAYRGVRWHKRQQCWHAYAQRDGKRHFLGMLRDELEAARVAREWRAEHMPFSVERDAVSSVSA